MRRKNHLVNVLISLSALLLTLIFLECIVRLFYHQPVFSLKDYRFRTQILYKRALPIQFDPMLGWIPEVGYSSKNNIWQTQITILENGVRSNDNADIEFVSGNSTILAVGDSFVFGDQVSNHETWPAILERLLNKRVINAGVFAYGIDQIFLRLTHLLDVYHPDIVIFSFIPSDIKRCEFATLCGANKPYFKVKSNGLLLSNSPVLRASPSKPRMIVRLLGYSYTIHKIMMNLAPNLWLQGYKWHENRQNPEGQGKVIAGMLFQELQTILDRKKVKKTYVLIQYFDRNGSYFNPKVDFVKNYINKTNMEIIDLKEDLLALKKENPELYQSFFNFHMTYKGNFFVAKKLEEVLTEREE